MTLMCTLRSILGGEQPVCTDESHIQHEWFKISIKDYIFECTIHIILAWVPFFSPFFVNYFCTESTIFCFCICMYLYLWEWSCGRKRRRKRKGNGWDIPTVMRIYAHKTLIYIGVYSWRWAHILRWVIRVTGREVSKDYRIFQIFLIYRWRTIDMYNRGGLLFCWFALDLISIHLDLMYVKWFQ